MRRLNSIIVLGLVVAAVAALILTVPIRASSPKTSSSPFRLKAVMRQVTFFLGVDIPVTAVLDNTGKKELKAALQRRPRAPYLIVEDSAGKLPECVMEIFDMEGPAWETVPPGKQLTLDMNAAEFYRIDMPGRYRLKCYARLANTKVYSNWSVFEVVPGKEAFRKDIKVIRPRPEPGAPKREDASLIVYALPKVHLAYYKRTCQKNGKKTTTYKRMVEVDPGHKPQVLTDTDGEVHILLLRRQLPRKEIEKRFKGFQRTYDRHLKYRCYVRYKTRASDGQLKEDRRLWMAKEDKTELRLVEAANRTIQVRQFKESKDLGVYSHPWKKPKPRSRPSQRPGATETPDAPKKSP